jgi:hypothetical protein
MKPVRSHRRPAAGWELAGWFALTAAVCIGGGTILHNIPWSGASLAGLAILYMIIRSAVRRGRERRAPRKLQRWSEEQGWPAVPVRSNWPWSHLVFRPDMTVVTRAYTKTLAGYPVTAGEIRWEADGLGRSVPAGTGHGVFVWIKLPATVPGMAVRLVRPVPRPRDGEDQFRTRFETIGFDSYRLDDPVFREAQASGAIPPWTVTGRDLFAFVQLNKPTTGADIEDAAARTLRITGLLDLGADRSSVADVPRHEVGPGRQEQDE